MSNTSSATPLSTAESVPNTTPNLSVVPPPEKRRSPSELNLRQVRKTERNRQICLAAQKAAYAPALLLKGIAAPFVATVLIDIATAQNKSTLAIQCTTNKVSATLTEHSAEKILFKSLREVQQAARQLHLHSDPVVLHDYLIGETIDQSRAILDQSAQTILSKASQEHPPGIDTGFILRVQAERADCTQCQQDQAAEQTAAQNERAQRDAMVKLISDRCEQVQIAADRAWPFGIPANAGVRREFRLPAKRPYVA